jgi:hypothetical protein
MQCRVRDVIDPMGGVYQASRNGLAMEHKNLFSICLNRQQQGVAQANTRVLLSVVEGDV